MTDRRVAVIGAGIAGLAAALALADGGLDVVVFDPDHRPGGKLRTSLFAGLDVDEGADSFLARVPEGRDLAQRVGLGDRLTSPAGGTASVAWRNRLHPLPGGLVLGVPSGFAGVARSRLLSVRGKARAALDLVRPATPADHDSLGRWVRDRFGDEVADLLVDPLVGSINAGGIDQLSLTASTPQLIPATRSRSALLAMRSTPKPGAGPVFHAPLGGMESLASATAEAFVAAGGTFRFATAVERIERDGAGWRIDGEPFDAVVVATPAPAAARLLGDAVPDTAGRLGTIDYAGVVMVTMAVPSAQVAKLPIGTGYLVPKPAHAAITAVSFASRKWAHLRPEGREILRVSLGRHGDHAALGWDDATIVQTATRELTAQCGTPIEPDDVRITRWPAAFPQYLPGHPTRVRELFDGLSRETQTVQLAGAAYQGLGVPACIRSGRAAAGALRQALAAQAK